MPELISFIVFVVLVLAYLYWSIKHDSNTKTDPELIRIAKKKIKATAKLDPNLAVLESHKILSNTVLTMFNNPDLSSAQIFNEIAHLFEDEKEFWHYHRMRNRVAHENDFKVSKKESARAREVFEAALSTF